MNLDRTRQKRRKVQNLKTRQQQMETHRLMRRVMKQRPLAKRKPSPRVWLTVTKSLRMAQPVVRKAMQARLETRKPPTPRRPMRRQKRQPMMHPKVTKKKTQLRKLLGVTTEPKACPRIRKQMRELSRNLHTPARRLTPRKTMLEKRAEGEMAPKRPSKVLLTELQ